MTCNFYRHDTIIPLQNVHTKLMVWGKHVETNPHKLCAYKPKSMWRPSNNPGGSVVKEFISRDLANIKGSENRWVDR